MSKGSENRLFHLRPLRAAEGDKCNVACPSALIRTSNVEVPVMLLVVRMVNR